MNPDDYSTSLLYFLTDKYFLIAFPRIIKEKIEEHLGEKKGVLYDDYDELVDEIIGLSELGREGIEGLLARAGDKTVPIIGIDIETVSNYIVKTQIRIPNKQYEILNSVGKEYENLITDALAEFFKWYLSDIVQDITITLMQPTVSKEKKNVQFLYEFHVSRREESAGRIENQIQYKPEPAVDIRRLRKLVGY
jgi:hypothetical protein